MRNYIYDREQLVLARHMIVESRRRTQGKLTLKEFLDSVESYILANNRITDKQLAALRSIYERATD